MAASTLAQPPGPRKGVIILALVMVVAAFACGFGALTVQADISQPVAKSASAVTFVVHSGDSASTVIANLESQKLIRNGTVLKLYLKLKGITFTPLQGTYQLSASMTLDQIIKVLTTPPPKIATIKFLVREGDRLSQIPDEIINTINEADLKLGNPPNSQLPNFDKQKFLDIMINGNGIDQFTSKYWFLKRWGPKSITALEGYLFPAVYPVPVNATTEDVINQMLTAFGQVLCPGPADDQAKYLANVADCKAHQATITMPDNTDTITVPGAKTTMKVFDALDTYYDANGTDYVDALQKALIIASIAQREARSAPHLALVASTYHNNWKEINVDPFGHLAADPTEQYWLGSQAGYTSDPWAPINSPGHLSNNPYNTYPSMTPGLPPSAISSPDADALTGAIYPPTTNFHFFYFGCDNDNHYFETLYQAEAYKSKVPVNNGVNPCPAK